VAKGSQAAASTLINKSVEKALGGVVPGVGAAVLMHFNGIYAAAKGDPKGVLNATIGGYCSMSGVVIGGILLPGIGMFIGGLIGSGVGALGAWGAGKLLD
jgi:hypothetical protein